MNANNTLIKMFIPIVIIKTTMINNNIKNEFIEGFINVMDKILLNFIILDLLPST